MSADLQLPPGFRFHPTDEELVMHYLCRKCATQSISVPIIAEIDLYKYDPWDLPGNFSQLSVQKKKKVSNRLSHFYFPERRGLYIYICIVI